MASVWIAANHVHLARFPDFSPDGARDDVRTVEFRTGGGVVVAGAVVMSLSGALIDRYARFRLIAARARVVLVVLVAALFVTRLGLLPPPYDDLFLLVLLPCLVAAVIIRLRVRPGGYPLFRSGALTIKKVTSEYAAELVRLNPAGMVNVIDRQQATRAAEPGSR